jgi:hypothetical protein
MKHKRVHLNIDRCSHYVCICTCSYRKKMPCFPTECNTCDIFFQMLSTHIYWFVYRRRTKCLLVLLSIVAFTYVYYQHDRSIPSNEVHRSNEQRTSRVRERSVRINRQTYTIPAPCRDCPGENGQGVQLTVRHEQSIDHVRHVSIIRLA